MLKTLVDDRIWLVQQPDHAQISGYLAAHWGDMNGFAKPGHFPGATHPAAWREEVILGIAEHDNGWWEWEAMPRISELDGLPVGLGERANSSTVDGVEQWRLDGFNRFRMGVERLAEAHPYSALLIALHGYWLYAVAFDDLVAEDERSLRHFIFSGTGDAPNLVGDRQMARQFLEEQTQVQAELKSRLALDAEMVEAIKPQHLNSNFRLLQLMDTLSLFLAMNDQADHELHDVPRKSWADRTTISWQRLDARTVRLDPYPFAIDPLPVHSPVRIFAADPLMRTEAVTNPLAMIHGAPIETIEFSLLGEV